MSTALSRKGDRLYATRWPCGASWLPRAVGFDFGARELNDAADPHEAALMGTMGLTAFASIAPVKTT